MKEAARTSSGIVSVQGGWLLIWRWGEYTVRQNVSDMKATTCLLLAWFETSIFRNLTPISLPHGFRLQNCPQERKWKGNVESTLNGVWLWKSHAQLWQRWSVQETAYSFDRVVCHDQSSFCNIFRYGWTKTSLYVTKARNPHYNNWSVRSSLVVIGLVNFSVDQIFDASPVSGKLSPLKPSCCGSIVTFDFSQISHVTHCGPS